MLEQNLVQLFVGGLNKPHQFLSCVNLATTLCHVAKKDYPEFKEYEAKLLGFKDSISNSLPVQLAEADRIFYLFEKSDSDEHVSITGTQFEMHIVHKALDHMLYEVIVMVAEVSQKLQLEFNFNINDYQVG